VSQYLNDIAGSGSAWPSAPFPVVACVIHGAGSAMYSCTVSGPGARHVS